LVGIRKLRKYDMNTTKTIYDPVFEALHHSDVATKNTLLYLLFNRYIDEWMEEEVVLCHTLFNRIAFLSKKYHWPPRLVRWCHTYRRMSRQSAIDTTEEHAETEYAVAAICSLIEFRYHKPVPPELKAYYEHIKDIPISFSRPSHKSIRRIIITGYQESEEGIKYEGVDETTPDKTLHIRDINLPETDRATLRETVELPDILPLVVQVMEWEEEGDVLAPKGIVIQPDYLVDITAVSECFEPDGINEIKYLLRKLTPTNPSHYLLIGNVANDFLDQLIRHPDSDFIPLLTRVFKQYPLHWIRYNDGQTRTIVNTLKKHYDTLKHTVKDVLPKENIPPKAALLEPSFYAPQYGIQGRLDLYYMNEKKKAASIVELKSGSTFRPNDYGLNINHYVQTLMYDRLIYSVYPGIKRMNYILYSKYKDKPLRFAPVISQLQKKAISVRNKIMYYEYWLTQMDQDPGPIDLLLKESKKDHQGFFGRDVRSLAEVLGQTSKLDRAYYRTFVGLMAREQQVARLGRRGLRTRRGVASLWLSTIQEKINQYDILHRLSYVSGDFSEDRPVITMRRQSHEEVDLVNFRVGDIAVLYPYDGSQDSVLHHQVFKCTVLSINQDKVDLRLRSAQLLEDYLKEETSWNLEHDTLDSTMNQVIRGMYRFLQAPKEKRELIYGLQMPRRPGFTPQLTWNGDGFSLHESQERILDKMVASKDYFLLWGPPGSGKTSVVLKYFVRYLMDSTEERVLLLAYTNRAVDEICSAVESLGSWYRDMYLRLGSRFATDPRHKKNLIHHALNELSSRKELLTFLRSKRVFITTLASLNSNDVLFETFSFDTVIVDEAGQILEAALTPVLTRFRRFILVGDHRQLPAVITQSEKYFETEDALLHQIGLYRKDLSLFERLIQHAQKNDWAHAYGMLQYQGRMHNEIVKFVSGAFYDSQLNPLPGIEALFESTIYPVKQSLEKRISGPLLEERCLYVPTEIDTESITGKTNLDEAEKIARIVGQLSLLIKAQTPRFNIGIITPYRAQIAQIKEQLGRLTEEMDITVDTVERYQGSARDVVVLSLCTNNHHQIKIIGAPQPDRLNRKLNVALTRARRQVIVLGNRDIMALDPALKSWIKYAFRWDLSERPE